GGARREVHERDDGGEGDDHERGDRPDRSEERRAGGAHGPRVRPGPRARLKRGLRPCWSPLGLTATAEVGDVVPCQQPDLPRLRRLVGRLGIERDAVAVTLLPAAEGALEAAFDEALGPEVVPARLTTWASPRAAFDVHPEGAHVIVVHTGVACVLEVEDL